MIEEPVENAKLKELWDASADAIEIDPMRPVRYGKACKYLKRLEKGTSILDIGCGEGTGLQILLDLGYTNLTGLEVSNERLKRASTKLPPSVNLRLATVDGSLPFSEQQFDAIISLAVIEHVLDPLFFCKEISRILRPGGYAVISSDCFSWRILQILGQYRSVQPVDKTYSLKKYSQIFMAAGLHILHFDTFDLPGYGNVYLAAVSGRFVRKLRTIIGVHTGEADREQGIAEQSGTARSIADEKLGSSKAAGWRRLANLIDNENIFFLQKGF